MPFRTIVSKNVDVPNSVLVGCQTCPVIRTTTVFVVSCSIHQKRSLSVETNPYMLDLLTNSFIGLVADMVVTTHVVLFDMVAPSNLAPGWSLEQIPGT